MPSSTSVNITPGVSVLGVLSHLNYEPWYALSEYVDNALQSAVADGEGLRALDPGHQLMVDIHIDVEGEGRIVIEDNAGGIHREDFQRAFRAADVPPDRSGLSEFGMGMKSASIWFARQWSVETSSIGDPNAYTVSFDIDQVLTGAISELPVAVDSADAQEHFTRITLWDLNQFPRGRTLGKIRDHMRDIYRVFLRSGALRLTVSGERMTYEEPRILQAIDARARDGVLDGQQAAAVEWRKPIDIELSSGVRMTGFAALREEGSTKEAGFSLFRRGRVIVGSGDVPYRPRAIFGAGNSYRSQRLFGEVHVDGLPVSHTKDGFQWGEMEEEFLELLRAELDAEPLPLLKQAEEFRSRSVSRRQAQFINAATDSTVRSVEQELPEVIAEVEATEADELGDPPEPQAPSPMGSAREVLFDLDHRRWRIVVAVAQDATAANWLSKSIDRGRPGEVEVSLTLNAGHPFVAQFGLGDKDSFEAVLRIAVAVVVAESLTQEAGLKFTGQMMRNINTVLTRALSGRPT